ncbi:MAG: hemin uptake protein HemP [Thiobacillaceae bacterium]
MRRRQHAHAAPLYLFFGRSRATDFSAGHYPNGFLCHGNQETQISHNGEHYRLRITKNSKLFRTK